MYEMTVYSGFNAAHRLREYNGKCENLHGHNWKVELSITFNQLDNNGMTMDFHNGKKILNEILEVLDHQYLNGLSPFKENNPTSENIAKYINDNVSDKIDKSRVKTIKVTVWETETSKVSYSNAL